MIPGEVNRDEYIKLESLLNSASEIVGLQRFLKVIPGGKDAYTISDKDDDASPNYFGFVDADGNWYILKETINAGNDSYRYCAGTSNYTGNWGNRLLLSYDYYYNIF